MESEVYRAEAADAGTRLDVWLAHKINVSRSRAQRRLETATLNGGVVRSSHILRAGDELYLSREDEPREEEQKEREESFASSPVTVALLNILFEDEALLVLNKPRGLTVHAGAGQDNNATLVDVLRANGIALSSVGAPERAGIVHRLDKDTTGVMVVAKTDAAHWKLAEDFAERRVTKEYTTLVCGVPTTRGRIEAPIGRHPVDRKKMAVVANGRPSITEYEVERSWLKFALLRVRLLTGRTHQIRVHLLRLGHPVVGDEVYGGHKRALQTAPNEGVRAALEGLGGQALHATRLAFAHPITGTEMSFEAPLSSDIKTLIAALDES